MGSKKKRDQKKHEHQQKKAKKAAASKNEGTGTVASETEPVALGINIVPPSPVATKEKPKKLPPSQVATTAKSKQLFMCDQPKQFIEDTNSRLLLYWCVDFPEKPVHRMFMATPLQGTAYLEDSSKKFELPFMHPVNTVDGRNALLRKSKVVKCAPDMDNIFHGPTGMELLTAGWNKPAIVFMGYPSESYPDLESWTKKLSEEIIEIMNEFGKNKKTNSNHFKLRHHPEFSQFSLQDIVPNAKHLNKVIRLFFNPSFPPFKVKEAECSMDFDDMVQNKAVIQKIFGPQGNSQMLEDLRHDIQIIP